MQKIISFILAETHKVSGGEVLGIPQSESAPHYFGKSVPKQVLIGVEEHKIKDKKVKFEIKAYLPNIILVEGQVEVSNIFGEEAFELREALIDECHKVVKKRGGKFDASEEYSIGIVAGYEGEPEQFFQYGTQIASFLKSEKLPLDENEVQYTLSSHIKYAKNDIVIVDWDGAFVFDPYGEYESIIELLQIANLQLLRYRILDAELDERLKKVEKMTKGRIGKVEWWNNRSLKQAFHDVINLRSTSVAEFEAIDREIKLIGEWYSARLYDLAAKKMKFDSWKSSIKEKLDSLEDAYSIVAKNFSMSRTHFLEFIQIILFFVLQVGWFVLIILEFTAYTKH